MREYKQLTEEDRIEIYAMKQAGKQQNRRPAARQLDTARPINRIQAGPIPRSGRLISVTPHPPAVILPIHGCAVGRDDTLGFVLVG
jgi:hypothetical protein